MRTDVMIKQLRSTAKKHENDKLTTFDTNISLMCTEVANRLEELEKEKQEIRNKTIDEFANKLCDEMKDTSEKLAYVGGLVMDLLSLDGAIDAIYEIAEQMKGSESDE